MNYGLRTKLSLLDVCFFAIELGIPMLVVEHLNDCLPDRRKAREELQIQLKRKVVNIMAGIGWEPPTRVDCEFRLQREFYSRNDIICHILSLDANDLMTPTILAVDFELGFHFKVVTLGDTYKFFFAVDQSSFTTWLAENHENWFERLSKELRAE